MQNLLQSQVPHERSQSNEKTGFNLLFSAVLLSLWKKEKVNIILTAGTQVNSYCSC